MFLFPSTFALSLFISFTVSLLPWGKYALYPFKLLTTWVHECSHAFMVIMLGGQVKKITLSPDTSGLTHFTLSTSRFKQSMVASSGYLGTTAVGCLVYFASAAVTARSHQILLAIAILLLFTAVFWVRNFFGAFAVLLLGTILVYASTHPAHVKVASYLLPFIGIQIGLNSIFDIRVLFGLDADSTSDARTMQTLLWLPAPFWATLWMLMSLFMMGWTVRTTALHFG